MIFLLIQIGVSFWVPLTVLQDNKYFYFIQNGILCFEIIIIVYLTTRFYFLSYDEIIIGAKISMLEGYSNDSEEILLDSSENEEVVIVDSFDKQKINIKFLKITTGFNTNKNHVITFSFYHKSVLNDITNHLEYTRIVQREKTTAEIKYFIKSLYKLNLKKQNKHMKFLQINRKKPDLLAIQNYCNTVLQEKFQKNFTNPLINEIVYIIRNFLEFKIKEENPTFICSGVSLIIDFQNDFLKETYLLNETFPNFYIHKISISSIANKTFRLFFEDRRNKKGIQELQKNFSEIKNLCNSFFEKKKLITKFVQESDLLELKYFLNLYLNEGSPSKVAYFLRTSQKNLQKIYKKQTISSIQVSKQIINSRCVGYDLTLSHINQVNSNSVSRSKEHFMTISNHLQLKFQSKTKADLIIDFDNFSNEEYIQKKINLYLSLLKSKSCIEFLIFIDYFSLGNSY